ncbi:VOC family protein [Dactylosporangium sucinum]|uniref:VOC domain-containing protein n=1 Tax=Dactylosporangium sucinum TaxID=1424081 RepID=A0A917X092_9ACTN|nr:VOC family protein [Dactylosporangium sucinum]GGM45816.1 hypothetical protein GCM10007977_054390 [Dactylosporangium sucinum]
MSSPGRGVLGPVIVTADTQAHVGFFTEVLGLEMRGQVERDAAEAERMWSFGQPVLETALVTPGTYGTVRLLQFAASASADTVRSPETGDRRDAFKVIDFYCPDPDSVEEHAVRMGARKLKPTASYETGGLSFSETHLWVGDGVVCALCAGDREDFGRFVRVRDRVASEVMSVSAPVHDARAAHRFYREILGLEQVMEYGFADESFQHMVGLADDGGISAVNYGSDLRDPFIGIIDYGPGDPAMTLRDARPPSRGIIACTVAVDSVADVLGRAAGAGLSATEPIHTELAPWGPTTSALVRSPNGILHHIVAATT